MHGLAWHVLSHYLCDERISVLGFGIRVSDFGFRDSGYEIRVQDPGEQCGERVVHGLAWRVLSHYLHEGVATALREGCDCFTRES